MPDIEESRPPNNPWTRKHDDPRINLIPEAQRIVYPKTLEEIIELCKNRPALERFKAAGSHWALSHAAISDHTFIETHDPREVRQVLGATIGKVIPECLTEAYLTHHVEDDAQHGTKTYLVHVEAGKRIYQLYAELDQTVDVNDPKTLAGFIKQKKPNSATYEGPWAFATLGGAGGQTVVGAISTGTHGGDFDSPPIADSVVAIHLVADGGEQYWIEPADSSHPLTHRYKLESVYPGIDYKRDTNLFNAVLVSAGRFGVIYSVVLKAVPQFMLHESRKLNVWQDVKHEIKNRNGWLFTEPGPTGQKCRFLQIAVCLTPHANFTKNLVGVTKRWDRLDIPVQGNPSGRMERVGAKLADFDQRLQAPLFEKAGNSHGYGPDEDDPDKAAEPSLLNRACADPSFLKGLLTAVADDIEEFVNSEGVRWGVALVNIATAGVGLLLLLPFFRHILRILRRLSAQFPGENRLGETMESIKNELLSNEETRAAGMATWQMIAYEVFALQQEAHKFDAISYAVMDRKDYLNISCEVNVDSVEVFFDSTQVDLINFVDALILFEMNNEFNGKAFAGYAALRFMGPSRGLLAMQKWETTCAVEVACLRDVKGSQELVDFAVMLARNLNLECRVHWGQRNDDTRADVEARYADKLPAWRAALATITNQGQLDGFSSEFTRRTGLEVL